MTFQFLQCILDIHRFKLIIDYEHCAFDITFARNDMKWLAFLCETHIILSEETTVIFLPFHLIWWTKIIQFWTSACPKILFNVKKTDDNIRLLSTNYAEKWKMTKKFIEKKSIHSYSFWIKTNELRTCIIYEKKQFMYTVYLIDHFFFDFQFILMHFIFADRCLFILLENFSLAIILRH